MNDDSARFVGKETDERDVLPLDALQTGLAAWSAWVGSTVNPPASQPVAAETGEPCLLPFVPRPRATQEVRVELQRQLPVALSRLQATLQKCQASLSELERYALVDLSGEQMLDHLHHGLEQLSTNLVDLTHFAVEPTPAVTNCRVSELVAVVCGEFALPIRTQKVTLTRDVPADHCVLADREQLLHMLRNLVRNAVSAMPNGGDLVITSYLGSRGLELEIADSGPGMYDELQTRACEPFYAARPGGLGLGLTVVQQIAAAHQAQVTLLNCPEGGAAVTLHFPKAVASARAVA